MSRPGAILVLHGFTASPQTVAAVVGPLQTRGFEVGVPTLRGHGTRPEALRDVRWSDWVDDALAAFDRLAGNGRDIAVAGHSMGALVAAEVAVRRPAVALALIAPALRFTNPLAPAAPLLAGILPRFPSPRSVYDEVAWRTAPNYKWFPVRAFAELFRLAARMKETLPRIRCPAVVFQSRRDQVVPPSAARDVHELLGSAEKELRWFEEIGHDLFLDRGKEAVAEEVAEWFAART
jgi:carboxylesterase